MPSGWLEAWRIHEAPEVPEERVRRLMRFHDALRLVVRPGGYGEYLRRPWKDESPIGARSILQAVAEDGPAALDKVESYLRGAR